MSGEIALPAGFALEAHETIGSTMDRARDLAGAGAADGTVVWARQQTAGRGRQGRNWVSPIGNLYLSILLRPQVPPGQAAQIGFLAALALAETLESALPADHALTCKWPNDLLLGGAKIAGILMESSGGRDLDWLILGTGVNLAAHPADTPYPACNLAAVGGTLSPEEALPLYLARLAAWRDLWQREGFSPVRKAWLKRAHLLGGPITARLPGGDLKGTFLDLEDDGCLALGLADGTRKKIAAAEILLGN